MARTRHFQLRFPQDSERRDSPPASSLLGLHEHLRVHRHLLRAEREVSVRQQRIARLRRRRSLAFSNGCGETPARRHELQGHKLWEAIASLSAIAANLAQGEAISPFHTRDDDAESAARNHVLFAHQAGRTAPIGRRSAAMLDEVRSLW